jgi:hypothetical protein
MGMIGGVVMEGIWFYWFAWMGWVVITFFLKKGHIRTYSSYFTLLLIITANLTMTFLGNTMSLGFLLMFVVAYMSASRLANKRLLFIFICTVILSLSFVSFYLFRLFDPVWVIFHPSFMLALILTYLTIILVKDLKERLVLFLLGVCHGDFLQYFVMKYFAFPHVVGSLAFFDITAIGLLFISVWGGLEGLTTYFNQSMTKNNKRKAGIL